MNPNFIYSKINSASLLLTYSDYAHAYRTMDELRLNYMRYLNILKITHPKELIKILTSFINQLRIHSHKLNLESEAILYINKIHALIRRYNIPELTCLI